VSNDQLVRISRDSFIEPLGLPDVGGALQDPAAVDALYQLASEYLAEEELIVSESPTDMSPNELPFKIPGTPLTVRMSQPTQEELTAILSIAVLVLGAHAPDELTLAGALAALGRVRLLRARYGERSMVEALSEAKPPTPENVVLVLYGKPCRYPDADCRFMAGSSVCGLSREGAAKTLSFLVERKVLRRLNATEPFEYALVV
jgi:hypothetical protein